MKSVGYKLYFQSLSGSVPLIHSDTLYSMVYTALGHLGVLSDGQPEFGFSLSSAFPFYQDFLFFPIPLDFRNSTGRQITLPSAQLFISENLLLLYLQEKLSKELPVFQSGCLLAEESHPLHFVYPIWKNQRMPAGNTTMNYLRFINDAGLFFLARFGTEKEQTIFETALNFLQDEGIGKNRTIGAGAFQWKKFTCPCSESLTKKHLLLSAYLPDETELEDNALLNCSIEWSRRTITPYFNSDKESKCMLMAKEGSIIKGEVTRLKGSTVKVFNENKKLGTQTAVYRFGKAFFL